MKWSDMLKIIFDHEAVICLIRGDWKTGKTNVGLKVIEDLLQLGIIDIAATNIEIGETDKIKYIVDFPTLRDFHYDHPTRPKSKCFILDEAGKITSRRSAMSKMNRAWFEFIPELSKGKMKLIVVTQSEFIADSIFTNTQFTKAILTTYKHGKRRYDLAIESELFKLVDRQFIRRFPMCETKYNPYSAAVWYLERSDIITEELLCCKVAKMYGVDDLSTNVIAEKFGLSTRTNVTRLIKQHIKHTFKDFTKEDIEELKRIKKEIEN